MKSREFAKYYAVITQGIFSIITLLLLGFYIGRWINKDSIWPPVLATIGAICGIIIFIGLILRLGGEKKNGRNE